MQSFLWVRLHLGKLFFSNTRPLSLGFPYQFQNVCIKCKFQSTEENTGYFTASNTTAPWLLPLGVTGCHSSCASPHPRAFTLVLLSSLHSPPDPAPLKQSHHMLLSSDFFLWAQVQAPGPGQSCTGQGTASPSPMPQFSEPRTRALSPRQGLGEEQMGRSA